MSDHEPTMAMKAAGVEALYKASVYEIEATGDEIAAAYRAMQAAAPAPRQPLTEDQVFASEDLMHLNGMMLRLSMTNLMQVVRTVERAHGITEDTCPKT